VSDIRKALSSGSQRGGRGEKEREKVSNCLSGKKDVLKPWSAKNKDPRKSRTMNGGGGGG